MEPLRHPEKSLEFGSPLRVAMTEPHPKVTVEDLIQTMADAMEQSGADQARELLTQFEFRDIADTSLINEICAAPDRELCVRLFGMLEAAVEKTICFHVVNPDFTAGRKLFSTYGLLPTFGKKLDLCSALGWVSKDAHRRAMAFAKVRNEFAHSYRDVRFSDAAIKDALSGSQLESGVLEVVMNGFASVRTSPYKDGNGDALVAEYRDHGRLFFAIELGATISRVFREALLWPLAQRFRTSPSRIAKDLDSGPDCVRAAARFLPRVLIAASRHHLNVVD